MKFKSSLMVAECSPARPGSKAVTTIVIIAQKTWRRNILDNRFLVASFLIILLMVVSGFVMGREMNERRRSDFHRRTSAVKNLEQVQVIKAPSPLAFIADGGEGVLPWMVTIKPEYVDTTALAQLQRSFIEFFPLIDWIFVVAVIMSLVALFFSFDLVAGEKEAGLLALQLSHPIRRSDFILGGYLGTVLSFCPVLLVGLLANLLIVSAMGSVTLDVNHLVRVGLTAWLALLYVSIFVLSGVLMSTLFHQSAAALISGLMIWTMFVVIIPQAGGALAVAMIRLPTDQQLQREINRVKDQLGRFSISGEMIRDIVSGPGNHREKQQRIDQWAAKLEVRYEKQYREMERRIGDVIRDYAHRRDQQVLLAQHLARLSPTAIFQSAVTELSNTGLPHHWNFLKNARMYRSRFAEYSDRTKRAKRDQAKPTAQGSAGIDGFTIHAVFHRDYSHIPVDEKTFPAFVDQWPPIRESLRRALLDVGLLIIMNVFLLAMAWVRFLRYDVRS